MGQDLATSWQRNHKKLDRSVPRVLELSWESKKVSTLPSPLLTPSGKRRNFKLGPRLTSLPHLCTGFRVTRP